MAIIDGTDDDDDFLIGTEEDDTIRGLDGNDFIIASDGDDLVEGGDGDDALDGGAGRDLLSGGAGDDTVSGEDGFFGPESDRLSGGAGDDRFRWTVGAQGSTFGAQDVVLDFQRAGRSGGDTIELRPAFSDRLLVFGGRLTALPALGSTIAGGGNGFVELFYATNGGDTVLFADSNDDGVLDAGDFSARFSGIQAFNRADFGDTPIAIPGTGRADVLTGTDQIDILLGFGGSDTLSGAGGNDQIDGGAGNDVLDGGAGSDRLIGGLGDDRLTGGIGNDVLLGNDGADRLIGGVGDDRAAGGSGDDIVDGGAGDDVLDGDEGQDVLFGGSGEDLLFGEDGNDTLSGDAGDDELYGDDGADVLDGGEGADLLEGDAGADTLTGGGGADTFRFFLGSFNPSSPFARHDVVTDFQGAGRRGGDLIEPGSAAFVWAGESDFAPEVGATLPGGGDGEVQLAYTQVDGHTLLVADENDNGRLDRSDFAVEFRGTLDFTTDDFSGAVFAIAGTGRADTLVGTDGDDLIVGLGGNDLLSGGAGNDTIRGGLGNDVIHSGTGFDLVAGGAGDDILYLEEFGSALGGAGNDRLFGTDAAFSFTELYGEAGNDVLTAGSSGSVMDGGTGADRLVSGAGDDTMTGGTGADRFAFGRRWGSDFVADFENGVDRIDLRTSGLGFADLVIEDRGFQTAVSSAAGTILLSVSGPGTITATDFLF